MPVRYAPMIPPAPKEFKTCPSCNLTKRADEYHKNSKNKSGIADYCKSCSSIRYKKYRDNNKEKVHEKSIRYYQENKLSLQTKHKNYYESNKEKLKPVRSHYYFSHKEKLNSINNSWWSKNPGKRVEYFQAYRARKHSSGRVSSAEIQALLDFYDNKCLCCGKENTKLAIDHIVPLKLGGVNSIENLQPLCKSCNSKKNINIIDYRNGRYYYAR